MPYTASLPMRKATSSPLKPTAASACRNSSTRASCGRKQSSKPGTALHLPEDSVMRKTMLSVFGFAFVFALAIPSGFRAQTQSPAPHLPRGTATDISSVEIQSLVQKTAADRVSDQAIRVVSVNGEYNVSIGVVHRAKTSGKDAPGGIEHAQITEVYHVIEGNGTLVT